VIERSYQLQHACRAPLVVTLACLADEKRRLDEDTTRSDLYRLVPLHCCGGAGTKRRYEMMTPVRTTCCGRYPD
jgi:hypothetical protein